MALVLGIAWDFPWLIIAALVVACAVVVAWGLFRYRKAEGDGKRKKVAVATIVGGAVGLVALVAGFMAYGLGFVDVKYDGGDESLAYFKDCDGLLRLHTQARDSVDDEYKAGAMIQAIQNQSEYCTADQWMGPNLASETGGALALVVGRCGFAMPTGSVKRVLDATAGVSSFGRVGGSIVMAFDTGVATHLTEKDNCWVYDAGSHEWYVGGNS